MSSSKTYSAKHLNILAAKKKLDGFGESDVVTITRDEGRWVKSVGADGRVSRSYVASTAGTVAITLMQTSEANETLTLLLKTDELTLKGQIPLTIQDTIGGSAYSATEAWLVGPPEVSYAKEVGEFTWTFDCADLAMYIKGGQGGLIAGVVNSISSAKGL